MLAPNAGSRPGKLRCPRRFDGRQASVLRSRRFRKEDALTATKSDADSRLTRRQFVRLSIIGGAAVLWAPGCQNSGMMDAMESVPSGPRFFTDAERRALGALADVVLPPDDTPGGGALGAADYIDQLLCAMDTDPPRIYAAGPFSNRNPQPLPDGRPGNPPLANDFQRFLPLTREQQLYWKLRLYGSDGVDGGGPNDAVLGKVEGWRTLCADGLRAAQQLAEKPLDQLDLDALADVWSGLSLAFKDFLTHRVLEAAFGAPEYGGNRNLAGWKLVHFEGDTLPLGFATYDETTGQYRERADAPVSGKNPGIDPDPLDKETHNMLRLVVGALGGRTSP